MPVRIRRGWESARLEAVFVILPGLARLEDAPSLSGQFNGAPPTGDVAAGISCPPFCGLTSEQPRIEEKGLAIDQFHMIEIRMFRIQQDIPFAGYHDRGNRQGN